MAATKNAEPKLPAIGDIVLFHAETVDLPMLVVAVGEDGVSGQAFGHGTEVHYVENARPGDEPGQFSLKG